MTIAGLFSQLLQVAIALLLAPLLVGWVNQCRAWLQNKRAPSLLVPYRTIHKLFMKDAVIADNAAIGDNTVLYPHTYIGEGATVGSDSVIYPGVTVYAGCRLGARTIVHSGSAIGSDGFGFVTVGGRPQSTTGRQRGH
jgi:serine acetyltransferase